MSGHLDDVEALRYVTEQVSVAERRRIKNHLSACSGCRQVASDSGRLDKALRDLSERGRLGIDLSVRMPPARESSRREPVSARTLKTRVTGHDLRHAEDGFDRADLLLDRLRDAEGPGPALASLSLGSLDDRFAVFYAVQRAGLRVAEGAKAILGIAEAVLSLSVKQDGSETSQQTESTLPWELVRGQAHMLAGQANLWLRAFVRSRSHLLAARRIYIRAGDETGLAMVDLAEAQRYFFVGKSVQALSLAHRARLHFELCGSEDVAARAAVAEGMALASAGRYEEAEACYRDSLVTFERFELWSNYVGAINSLATTLFRAGKLDGARREFARALRRFAKDAHRSWSGYLQHGLGDILIAAGRIEEAVRAFQRASKRFEECELHASSMGSQIAEAECWLRLGRSERARELIAAVMKTVGQLSPGDVLRDRLARLDLHTPTLAEIAGIREILSRRPA